VVCCIIKARESDTYRSNKGWPSALLKLKYDVSYQQVYTWVKKYSELGEAGLEDRRGRRAAQQEPRTKEEEMQAEIARLKHELYMSNMERDLLKKVKELERRDRWGK
jgi:transposase-like protein